MALPAFGKTINLTTKNTVRLSGEITAVNMRNTSIELSKAVQNRRSCATPLYLVIDSSGGSIDAGNKFIRYAKTICNLQTLTLDGASMACAIAMQLPGRRYTTDISTLMFHRARATFSGQVESGEVETRLALEKTVIRHMEVLNAKRIGITLKDYKAKVVNEWLLYGQQAVDAGVMDEIVDVKCSNELQNKTVNKTVETLFGLQQITTSACPLI